MNNRISRLKVAAVAALAFLSSNVAMAQQKAGDVADGVTGQYSSFANLATGGAMLIGIFVGIASLMKFKAYNDNPQQTKISQPIILLLVAAGLIGLPAYLTMGKDTVLEGDSNSLNSPVYQNIG